MSNVIVLDTETTGVNTYSDRVVEVVVVDFDTGMVLLETLVNPGIRIPAEATQTHGITDADVAGAPWFSQIAVNLANMITGAKALIGYNPFFDRQILAREFERCSVKLSWPILICAKRIWDKHEPPKSRNLSNAHKRFTGTEFEPHRALSDVQATRLVVLQQLTEFNLHDTSWDEMDPEQRRWIGGTNHLIWSDDHSSVVINFGKHEGKSVHDVDKGYWRWVYRQDFPTHVMQIAYQLAEFGLTPDGLKAWIKTHL